jgi:OOP family OmpA-OmpF porin
MNQSPMNTRSYLRLLLTLLVILAPIAGIAVAVEETGDNAPWHAIFSLSRLDFEGDEELSDGMGASLGIGYDYSDLWTFEGNVYYVPRLDVDPTSGISADNTYCMGATLDALFHFTRWKRVDPYLAAGIGLAHYGEELQFGNQDDFVMRGGGGVIYHINDEWALRADFRGMLAGFGESPNANSLQSLAVIWTWGGHVPVDPRTEGDTVDTDADGLSDADERDIYKTDPHDADTDNDDLDDYAEVKEYQTDPLKPDTDLDMLTDGEEVHRYNTDPNNADTDGGKVSDGHEVLEDHTNPLQKADDLLLYSLNIEFDPKLAVIKPQFAASLDTIGKVLRRFEKATAVIEGHADKRRSSLKTYNQRLSEKRAKAVLVYLRDKAGVDAGRMKAKGYGFSRPIADNDPVNGNPRNRRVDIYIEGADAAKE